MSELNQLLAWEAQKPRVNKQTNMLIDRQTDKQANNRWQHIAHGTCFLALSFKSFLGPHSSFHQETELLKQPYLGINDKGSHNTIKIKNIVKVSLDQETGRRGDGLAQRQRLHSPPSSPRFESQCCWLSGQLRPKKENGSKAKYYSATLCATTTTLALDQLHTPRAASVVRCCTTALKIVGS